MGLEHRRRHARLAFEATANGRVASSRTVSRCVCVCVCIFFFEARYRGDMVLECALIT